MTRDLTADSFPQKVWLSLGCMWHWCYMYKVWDRIWPRSCKNLSVSSPAHMCRRFVIFHALSLSGAVTTASQTRHKRACLVSVLSNKLRTYLSTCPYYTVIVRCQMYMLAVQVLSEFCVSVKAKYAKMPCLQLLVPSCLLCKNGAMHRAPFHHLCKTMQWVQVPKESTAPGTSKNNI